MRIASLSLILGAMLALPTVGARAQAITAFKTGEQTSGMTKQCTYAFGASEYTRTVSAVALCPLSIKVAATPTSPTREPLPKPPQNPGNTPAPTPFPVVTPPTITAFKTGERTTGMTKQCYYAFGATGYTKTVRAVDLCPLSIKVRQ